MRPMVITNVSDESPLMTEEIFGPVTCIVPFKTEEEVRRYIFLFNTFYMCSHLLGNPKS